MKSYNHLFEIALSEPVRRKAVHNVTLGRKIAPQLNVLQSMKKLI